MNDLRSLLADGSGASYIVLAFASLGILLGLAQIVRRDSIDVSFLLVASVPFTLFAGALGTLLLWRSAIAGVASLDVDAKAKALATGIAQGLAPIVLALGVAIVQVVVVALAITVRANVANRPSRPTPARHD